MLLRIEEFLSFNFLKLLNLIDDLDVVVVIGIEDLAVFVRLVHCQGDRTCHENMRSVVVVIFVFNSVEHSHLVFIRLLKLVFKKFFMECTFVDEDLLLETENQLPRGDSLGQLHLKGLSFLLFFLKKLSLRL